MVFNPSKARELFEKSGRSKKYVSDFMRIEISSLNRLLNGSAKPSRPVLKLFSMALECKEEDFLDKEEVAS